MSRSSDGMVSADQQILRLNWALAAYARSSSALIRHQGFDDLASRICQAIVERGYYRLAFIALAQAAPGKSIRIVASAGPGIAYVDGLRLSWADDVPEGQGPAGHAIRTGTAYFMRDSALDPAFAPWRERALANGLRSSVTVPLRKGADFIGAMVVFASQPDAFGAEELNLFQQLADEAAFAMSLDEDRRRMQAAEAAREASRSAVREERDFSEAMIRGLPGVLYVYDEAGAFLRWNQNFERVSGYGADDIATMRPADFIAPADRERLRARITETFAVGESRLEAGFLSRDGRITPYYFTGVATLIEGRKCLVGVGIDMSEQKQAQEAARGARDDLARVARVSTLGAFSASISHEINQPLAAIVTNSDASLRWLAHAPPNIDEARLAIKRTIRDATRADAIIKRIKSFLSKQDIPYSPVQMNEIALEIITLTQSQQSRDDVYVKMDFRNNLPLVRGDRTQLQQVLLNLIMNAIDAMKSVIDRPRILSIRTRVGELGKIVTEVEDCGIGLDPSMGERLFDRFFTTKSGGAGLGLSISRSIIEAHGGRLWASPATPNGAIFSFALPAWAEPTG